MKRPRRDPAPVARLLARVLDDLGLGSTSRVVRIAERWPEAVGERIAGHSRPLVLRGEELEVGVESSVWAQELQLCAPQLLAGLRRTLGDDAPSKLRLRVARLADDERRS